MKKLKRLQGREWHEMKDNLIYIKTLQTTDEGNVKILVKDENGTKYVHWLSDKEKPMFEMLEREKKSTKEHGTCFDCENCIPIGEGDHLCDCMMALVLEDYSPTDDFLGCGGSYYERR